MQDREQTPPTKGGDYRVTASPYAANAESDLQWTGLSSFRSALPGSSIQHCPVRPIGTEGVPQLNGSPTKGRPVETDPRHAQWAGLPTLDNLCRCQTIQSARSPRGPSACLWLAGLLLCGHNRNDPPGLPGGSLLVTMTDRDLVHIVPGRLFWGHDGDHTPPRNAGAIPPWRIP